MKLLLMPGMDGTGELFTPLLSHLRNDIEAVVFRYPFDPRMGYPELLTLVKQQLPEGEPYVVLGESFSGPLAIQLAASNPAGLCGVILCASFVTSPAQWFPRWAASRVSSCWFSHPFRTPLAIMFLANGAEADSRHWIRTILDQVPADILAARLRAVLRVDVRPELPNVSVPIHYLQAEHDRLVPASCLSIIQKLKPNVTFSQIAGPHLLLQTQPVEAARLICAKSLSWQGTPTNLQTHAD